MIDGRVVLAAVVSVVAGARCPEVSELALGTTSAEPPKANVHGLQHLADHDVVGDAGSSGVVALDGQLGLGPAHYEQSLAKGDHHFGADIERSKYAKTSTDVSHSVYRSCVARVGMRLECINAVHFG